MKLPATRIIPIEMEIGWQPASEGTQAFEQSLPIGRARDHERARTGGVNLDIVTLLQLERLDDGSGKRTARLLPHLETCMVDIR